MTAEVLLSKYKKQLTEEITKRYHLNLDKATLVEGHEGGRNVIFICDKDSNKVVLRISALGDRSQEEYLAEVEFVHNLAKNGASVADVMLSENMNYVEEFILGEEPVYISLFALAPGILISDNGYQYREGVPLAEYFYNTGKVLGRIHEISKKYVPKYKRYSMEEHYNKDYINELISDKYVTLKKAIFKVLDQYSIMKKTDENYGLVHFDFSDGNYNINYENGDITVYDFDNCCYCFYLFDLANLWTHGVGWIQWESNIEKRKAFMKDYFDTIVTGYRSETQISDEMLDLVPFFIQVVLVEGIIDEFECMKRIGEEVDPEDIENSAECLINDIPYTGFFMEKLSRDEQEMS